MAQLRPGHQFSRVVLALDQVTTAGVLVAWLSTGAELTAHEAGRLVSGRNQDEWQALEKARRSRFIDRASAMLRCMSGTIAIYDSLEWRDGARVCIWRFVGGTADLELFRIQCEEQHASIHSGNGD